VDTEPLSKVHGGGNYCTDFLFQLGILFLGVQFSKTCHAFSPGTIVIGRVGKRVYLLLYKQNWLQFLFVVKATALKQQISELYPQILSTEASYHIYTTQWHVIKVKATLVFTTACTNLEAVISNLFIGFLKISKSRVGEVL